MIRLLLLLILPGSLFAADKVIREDWKETPPSLPIDQSHVANEDLTLVLHGDVKNIKKSHHANKKNDPFYVWSGKCRKLWALSLSLKVTEHFRGNIELKWRTKQSSNRVLFLIVQDAGGNWYIASKGTASSKDWKESSINLGSKDWHKYDIKTLKRGDKIEQIELNTVKAFGFTDLQVGGDSKACSRLDWIQVTLK